MFQRPSWDCYPQMHQNPSAAPGASRLIYPKLTDPLTAALFLVFSYCVVAYRR